MATININIPEEILSDLSDVAAQLKLNAEQCMKLALSHFLQSDALTNAMEGVSRTEDDQILMDFPELQQELNMNIKFHPQAMEELESLPPEAQINVLEQLLIRITSEEEMLEETLDLVLDEDETSQLLLSEFNFGDVIYQTSPATIKIYHIALLENEEENELDDLDEEDFEEDEEEFNEEEIKW